MQDFVLNVAHHRAAGAVCGQLFAHDVHNSSNASQRIADFVRQSGGQFAEAGQMLRAQHFAAVELFDFRCDFARSVRTISLNCRPSCADIVLALGKIDVRGQVAAAYSRNRIHQFLQRLLHQHQQHGKQDKAQTESRKLQHAIKIHWAS